MEGFTFSAEDAHEDAGHVTDDGKTEEAANDNEEDVEEDDESEDSGEDDTAIDAPPPITLAEALSEGHVVQQTCPHINNALIGQSVLYKWDDHGWCVGCVKKAIVAPTYLAQGLNFEVKYEVDEFTFRQGLIAANYGQENCWVVLEATK